LKRLRRLVPLGALAVGASLLGCDTERDATRDDRSAVSPQPVFVARAPARGRVIGGEVIRRRVEHPTPAEPRLAATPALRTEASRTPLPVLVPPDGADRAQLHTGDGWYALTVHGAGYTINLQASARARLYPGIVPHRGDWDVRGTDGVVTSNEGIWSISWVEHNVAYSLELECSSADSAMCRDEDAAVAIVESLALVVEEGPR
jgi:hypothetical protein